MGFPFNGDLVPIHSGFANLGVDTGSNGQNAFGDPVPFNHVHMISGVFHDPLYGQSGVFRFNQQQSAFQVSVDGGLTFNNISAGSAVDSIGVVGDTNLTGNVDLASAANSGFLAIFDTADASPIQFAVDQLGLSGLWGFPSQGFNGSVVNELTDSNGTTTQGSISVVGASGIIVDIVGQTLTIAANTDVSDVARCYNETFAADTRWTVNHNLDTENVIVAAYDDSTPPLVIFPDNIEVTNSNTVRVAFNVAQAGYVVIMGC